MKKYVKYLLFVFMIFCTGISITNAACYKKTITKKNYSTFYCTTGNCKNKSVTSKKIIREKCGGKSPCWKVTQTNVYSTNDCEKSTSDTQTVTCKIIDVSKCEFLKNDGEVWNSDYAFSSPTGLAYIGCGNKNDCPKEGTKGTGAYDIPVIIPELTSYAVTLLKIVTPVILIIMGMVQLIKAIVSQKEDEIKKGQNSLIKKVIIAVMIFFVISIVQFVISKVADKSESGSLQSCMQCFLNGPNSSACNSIYYRDANGDCKEVK